MQLGNLSPGTKFTTASGFAGAVMYVNACRVRVRVLRGAGGKAVLEPYLMNISPYTVVRPIKEGELP